MAKKTPTPNLEARLQEALAERDAALLELARERELTNALRLHALSANEPEPPRHPASAGVGKPPLRYVVVDQANEQLKAVLGLLQGRAKNLTEKLLKGGR